MYKLGVEWVNHVMGVGMEKLAYVLLGVAVISWVLTALEIVQIGGLELSALTGVIGIALLIIKVIVERLKNKEDGHYSRVVKK